VARTAAALANSAPLTHSFASGVSSPKPPVKTDGIIFNEHTDEDGATVFRHACKLGLEGIVSKRLSKPYQSGRSGHWLKVKSPDSPAMVRAREHFARLRQ
jgi:bifunctional non-homologous end joining protein LigD